jgi:hypothetical protein
MKAIESNENMIKCIKKIDKIDINQWVNDRSRHLENSDECSKVS